MPELLSSTSAPTPNPSTTRPRTTRATTSTAAPKLNRVFSAIHLDDHSTYHGGDYDSRSEYDTDSIATSDYSEKAYEEDAEDAREAGKNEVETVQGGIRTIRDLESGLQKTNSSRSARPPKDPNLVTWEGPDDPANPKNWTMKKKWAATVVVSSFTFISPVSSSMVAPALATIAKDFTITNEVESQLVLSVFVLAYAIGPLFLGPLSEMYGRIPVLQLSNLFYLAFNLACGFAQTKGQMIAFRFLSGLGGSAPLAIGGGILSDCWRADQRGRALSIYSLAPLLGPAIGPIAGGFITQNTTWRWAFYATSIADGVIQLSGLVFLQETYPPKLLHVKANKLRKETGNKALHTEFEHPERSLAATLKRSLTRPFKLLFTQPIIIALAIYMAYIYGVMYLVLSTFPVLWSEKYHQSLGIGGLNYVALGLGFFLGTQICAPLNDRIYRYLRDTRGNGKGRPEFRVPLMLPASLLVPVGLFLYGWSAEYKTHWIVPDIGAAFLALGVIVCFQSTQVYIVDAYTQFAASAIGAATVLRSLAGFGFPLFAPTMYASLGYGWGNSVLGFAAVALGIPAPIALWFLGEKLRKKSKFAAGGGDS